MITIIARSGRSIELGREGENLAREVIFDVSSWRAEYGDGTVSLIAQRSGDTEPYPCTVTVDGSAVTWLITASDTAQAGYGRCELRYAVGDALAKSETWLTYTADALGTPAPEPPEPQKAWVDKVLAAGQAAVDASVNSPKIGSNGNWWTWDFEAGAYVDTGVAASGGGSGAVSSVNGKTGAVKLTAEDVGAVPVPETASVGQTIVVKAVDEAGKPTEWEAVDMPSKDDWKKLVDVTTEEDVSSFTFPFDDVEEIIIIVSAKSTCRRFNFFISNTTNVYHYEFFPINSVSSNVLRVGKRIGGMRYVCAGWPASETPDSVQRYALLTYSTQKGMLVNSSSDNLNSISVNLNTADDYLYAGARIQIFGR